MRNNEDYEKEIRSRLKNETDKTTDLKDETWEKIQQELFTEQRKKVVWPKRVGAALGMVAVAAILFVIVSSGMFTNEIAEEPNDPETPDQSTENDPETDIDPDTDVDTEPDLVLADVYDEEIQMEIEVEGMKEMLTMKRAVSEEERYVIYIEKDKYEFTEESGEGIVHFIQEDDRYPPVDLFIRKQTNTTLEEQIQHVKEEIDQDAMIVTGEDEITDPFDGYMVKAFEHEQAAWEWDTAAHLYYITEVRDGIFFQFKMTYFVEALDGFPNRMNLMLETFEYAGEGSSTDE